MENEYFVELLVRERLTQAEALAARQALIDSLRPPRRPLRVAVGLGLIRVGRWVLGGAADAAAAPDTFPWRQTAEP
jgi:hypothetical protein